MGISPLITLPIAYAIHIFVVFKKKYATAEKYLLAVSSVMLVAYLIFMSRGVSSYSLIPPSINSDFLFLITANVGAVIMPFMLFYQTTATAKKEFHSVRATKIETFVGAIFSEVLMVAIVIVSASLDSNLTINSNHDISNAIMSLGGTYTPIIFSVGLMAAGFLALVVISLASAWGVVESLGIKGDMWFKIYIVETLPAVMVPLLFGNLIALILALWLP